MNKSKNRRYYLHYKLKGHIKVKAKLRTLYVTDGLIENLAKRHRKYLDELKDKFGYNAQYVMTAQKAT